MFVTLEGPEGAGKSTALRSMAEALRTRGFEVVPTREPGGSPIGPEVRRLLLDGGDLSREAELFLFLADRTEHVYKVIRPALERGAIVLCDRYGDSTVVYQGHARGGDLTLLRSLNTLATGGLVPGLTLLLDLPAEAGLARITQPDRLDREPLAFHQAVRQGFLAEAQASPERWVVIDALAPPDEVSERCLGALLTRLDAGAPTTGR
jgi:dTMP kinase